MVDEIFGELGASDVPLTEAVIKKPPAEEPFRRTELEWVAKNRKQILAFGQDFAAGSTDIYIVPANTLFFLTGWHVDTLGAAAGTAVAIIESETGAALIRLATHTVLAGDTLTSHSDLTMPLKMETGQKINLFGNASAQMQGSIWGWEEPSPI